MKKVALVFGGRSAEHDVSVASARAVMENLDRNRYRPVLIYINRSGRWSVVEESIFDGREPEDTHSFLPWANRFTAPPAVDICFPLLHGPNGEDGKIQAVFEMAGVPFVGASSFASGLAMNKHISKKLFRDAGLKIPRYLYFEGDEKEKSIGQIQENLSFPVFVKPNSLGSSVGISKVKTPGELPRALEAAFGHDYGVVVEEAVHCREIEICVMGNRDLQVSPPGEVIPFNEFYDYEDKYLLGKTRFEIPARLKPEQKAAIRDQALRAFTCLHLNGWARVDFLLDRDTGDWFVNEINTIPGFTAISMFPKLWIEAGFSFRDLVTRLINLGFEYHREGKR